MARILVIDDDEAIRDLLRKILEQDGHEIVEASDGNEGVDAYRQAPADLVITDLFMPEKDGLSLIEEIRRDYPKAQIISITAGLGDDCAMAKELGAARTFVKPISVVEIRRAVVELLRLHKDAGDGMHSPDRR